MASAFWRERCRGQPNAVSPVGPEQRKVSLAIDGHAPLPMTASRCRLVRGRSGLRRRRALSLSSCRTGQPSPIRRRAPKTATFTAPASLSIRDPIGGDNRIGAGGPGMKRSLYELHAGLMGGFAGVVRASAATGRAWRHRRRTDADRGFSRRAQLGLRRRAALCAGTAATARPTI